MTEQNDIETILDQLESRHDASVDRLRKALTEYAERGIRPDPSERDDGAFAYPELRIEYDPETPPPAPARAFARLNQPGIYTTSIARPALFREYLREQLEHIVRDYPVEISVGTSASEIPYPYVLDGGDLDLQGISTAELSRWFPSTDLIHIGDEVADGAWDVTLDPTRPLALFDALRTDFSLARLKHYTGTPAEHFSASCCSPIMSATSTSSSLRHRGAARSPPAVHQPLRPRGTFEHGALPMPKNDCRGRMGAAPDARLPSDDPEGDGIPWSISASAPQCKTLCDHIAVLRPEAWLMIAIAAASAQPDDRRLCSRSRLCATTMYRRRVAGRSPDPRHRRGPDRRSTRRAGGHRRG